MRRRWHRSILWLPAMGMVAGGSPATAASDDAFPSRPLRIITGFSVGGVSDVIARAVGEQVGRQLGQRMFIDTRPGAGGTLSMGIAAKATPDGYTLHLATPVITLSPLFLDRKLGFDPLKVFAPVSMIGTGPTVLAVHPKVAAKSVAELISLAKGRPDGLRIGHSGDGSLQHLAGELYRVMSSAPTVPVPYRSAQESILATLRGEVDATFIPLSSAMGHLDGGRLRGLGVTSARRAKAKPDIPSIAETLPGYNVFSWYGLLVPSATPAPVVDRLNEEVRKALAVPVVYELLDRQGVEVHGTTPAEFAAIMLEDHQRWAKLVKDAGIVLR